MKRSLGIKYLPQSTNFSELEPWQVENLEDKQEQSELEITILSLIHNLSTDRQRVVLLIELLRQLGYNIDYTSAAKAMHIELRWYMRLKKRVKELLTKLPHP